MQLENIKEKILLARLKNKDKEAFIRAYDLYLNQIYRFIYFKVGDKEEAQDLTSAVFLKAWNYIQNNNLKDEKSLRALFYKIARNSVIDYYRENSSKYSLASIENETEISDEKKNVIEEIDVAIDFSLVEKKLSELKDEYREIIILRYIEEMSVTEIAEILNKTKGNIRILCFRALKALQDLMEE